MIGAAACALAVAAINTAAGRRIQRLSGSNKDRFWRIQALGFAFRFATIFGAASILWNAHHRMPEVALFVILGAAAQTMGQIYFLTRDKKPYA